MNEWILICDLNLIYSLNIEKRPFPDDYDLLRVPHKFQQLVAHPCDRNVALYIRVLVFFTRDGFQSSLYPLEFPKAWLQPDTRLTAAIFVEDHLAMLIGGNVYLFHPHNKSWIPSRGINTSINGITSNQCCINKDPFCKRISSLVIAYHKSANMSQVSLWLSTDGGLEFSKIAPELPLKGSFEGAFIFPTISALALLIREYREFYFRYIAIHSNLTATPFNLHPRDRNPYFIQPVGMQGHLVIWSVHTLLFSPNHGQNVYPIRYYDLPGQVTHVLFQKRIIQQVICNTDDEIAMMTIGGEIYFGKLNIGAKLLRGSIINQ
ncbi:cation channel sperm-associated auxiliary subunit delta-like isoform X2 [Leucoraja erinacea]|uniref:cation channel sperm-associated auxiliary subunit delta-like isoform X2 n=1 Tax=Leucoraja erinaceus TaxID=7782 RepID=UPI002454E159|nr:cation channel sperm-associated auxiliary subunit delta-like isoform X2 [Leucoraja erinacea]